MADPPIGLQVWALRDIPSWEGACIQLADAFWALEGGYCLWIGAGLTRQIAAGRADVPLWDQLTKQMEKAAGIEPGDSQDFPNRLDACWLAMGEGPFRVFLRKSYYTELCVALLSQAAEYVEKDDCIPDHVPAVAGLGQLANPIISFNVEFMSSLLVARPAGPVRILSQRPRRKPTYRWQEPADRFQRIVYHPHGLAIGDSVMTSSQYQAMRQDLTFRLAIHSAFGNTLVIVGMSLNDDHLRRQIEKYRSSLDEIYWFDSQFQPLLATWADGLGITTVEVDWADFWNMWQRPEVAIARDDLWTAWYLAVSEAAYEASGGALGSYQRLVDQFPEDAVPEGLRRIAMETAAAARDLGEPEQPVLVGGQTPQAIELAVRQRLMEKDIPLPRIARTYGPGDT